MASGEKIEGICRATLERCVFPLKLKEEVKIGNFVLKDGMKVLVDGEYRDEALWAGDYYSSGPASYKYLGDEGEIWRNSLLAIATKQYPSGRLPSVVSTQLKYRFTFPSIYIDSYNFWWVLTANEYIKKTGDKDFTEVFKTALGGVIKYFSPKVDTDSLIVMNWPNIDWNWMVFRPRKSVLSNALWYKVLTLAEEYGVYHLVARTKMKQSFNNHFWKDNLEAYADNGTIFLDANSLAILFELADEKRSKILHTTLEKTIGEFGPVSYLGNPFAITGRYKDLVCPFAAYVYVKALEFSGRERKAGEVFEKTMNGALGIHHKYNSGSLPEFWKSNGELGESPAIPFIKNKTFAVSLCHAWATFGDYDTDKEV